MYTHIYIYIYIWRRWRTYRTTCCPGAHTLRVRRLATTEKAKQVWLKTQLSPGDFSGPPPQKNQKKNRGSRLKTNCDDTQNFVGESARFGFGHKSRLRSEEALVENTSFTSELSQTPTKQKEEEGI